MTEKKVLISVSPRKVSVVRGILAQAVFWGFLVGSIGLSHQWFGGSWVIDISAFCLAAIMFAAQILNMSRRVVNASVRDLQAWAKDGAPSGLYDWLRERR